MISSQAYLRVFEHLLQAFLHQFEFARLNAAVGQQHAPKLPLCDPAINWVIPLKLHKHTHKQRISKTVEFNHMLS